MSKPATPLPWTVVINDGANGIAGRIDPVSGRCIPRGLDAIYIVHAANAYPRLVEQMKEALMVLDYRANQGDLQASNTVADILPLLRELGEAV